MLVGAVTLSVFVCVFDLHIDFSKFVLRINIIYTGRNELSGNTDRPESLITNPEDANASHYERRKS